MSTFPPPPLTVGLFQRITPSLQSFLSILSLSSLSVSSFWQTHYTSKDTWLFPFLVPMIFWISMWIHQRFVAKQSFAKFLMLHDVHHIVAMIMGLTSIYINNDRIFNERIVILWSTGYFCVDVLDCLVTRDYIYIFHGGMSLLFGLLNYKIPLLRELRMHSKAVMMKLSTIPLHQAKQTKDPTTFVIFAIVFTACRIISIPVMMKELYDNDAHWSILTLLSVFYVLQVHWWTKIVRIIIRGPRTTTTKNNNKKESNSGDDDDNNDGKNHGDDAASSNRSTKEE